MDKGTFCSISLTFAERLCCKSSNSDLQCCMDKYGNEYRDLYLKPFSQIQDIPDIYIDGFLNTLCYFYPDYIGDYYKLFIHALQNAASEYLRNSI